MLAKIEKTNHKWYGQFLLERRVDVKQHVRHNIYSIHRQDNTAVQDNSSKHCRGCRTDSMVGSFQWLWHSFQCLQKSRRLTLLLSNVSMKCSEKCIDNCLLTHPKMGFIFEVNLVGIADNSSECYQEDGKILHFPMSLKSNLIDRARVSLWVW